MNIRCLIFVLTALCLFTVSCSDLPPLDPPPEGGTSVASSDPPPQPEAPPPVGRKHLVKGVEWSGKADNPELGMKLSRLCGSSGSSVPTGEGEVSDQGVLMVATLSGLPDFTFRRDGKIIISLEGKEITHMYCEAYHLLLDTAVDRDYNASIRLANRSGVPYKHGGSIIEATTAISPSRTDCAVIAPQSTAPFISIQDVYPPQEAVPHPELHKIKLDTYKAIATENQAPGNGSSSPPIITYLLVQLDSLIKFQHPHMAAQDSKGIYAVVTVYHVQPKPSVETSVPSPPEARSLVYGPQRVYCNVHMINMSIVAQNIRHLIASGKLPSPSRRRLLDAGIPSPNLAPELVVRVRYFTTVGDTPIVEEVLDSSGSNIVQRVAAYATYKLQGDSTPPPPPQVTSGAMIVMAGSHPSLFYGIGPAANQPSEEEEERAYRRFKGIVGIGTPTQDTPPLKTSGDSGRRLRTSEAANTVSNDIAVMNIQEDLAAVGEGVNSGTPGNSTNSSNNITLNSTNGIHNRPDIEELAEEYLSCGVVPVYESAVGEAQEGPYSPLGEEYEVSGPNVAGTAEGGQLPRPLEPHHLVSGRIPRGIQELTDQISRALSKLPEDFSNRGLPKSPQTIQKPIGEDGVLRFSALAQLLGRPITPLDMSSWKKFHALYYSARGGEDSALRRPQEGQHNTGRAAKDAPLKPPNKTRITPPFYSSPDLRYMMPEFKLVTKDDPLKQRFHLFLFAPPPETYPPPPLPERASRLGRKRDSNGPAVSAVEEFSPPSRADGQQIFRMLGGVVGKEGVVPAGGGRRLQAPAGSEDIENPEQAPEQGSVVPSAYRQRHSRVSSRGKKSSGQDGADVVIGELTVRNGKGETVFGPVAMNCPYKTVHYRDFQDYNGSLPSPFYSFEVRLRSVQHGGIIGDELSRPIVIRRNFIREPQEATKQENEDTPPKRTLEADSVKPSEDKTNKCPDRSLMGLRALDLDFDEFSGKVVTTEIDSWNSNSSRPVHIAKGVPDTPMSTYLKATVANVLKVPSEELDICVAAKGSTILGIDTTNQTRALWSDALSDPRSPVHKAFQFDTLYPSEVTYSNIIPISEADNLFTDISGDEYIGFYFVPVPFVIEDEDDIINKGKLPSTPGKGWWTQASQNIGLWWGLGVCLALIIAMLIVCFIIINVLRKKKREAAKNNPLSYTGRGSSITRPVLALGSFSDEKGFRDSWVARMANLAEKAGKIVPRKPKAQEKVVGGYNDSIEDQSGRDDFDAPRYEVYGSTVVGQNGAVDRGLVVFSEVAAKTNASNRQKQDKGEQDSSAASELPYSNGTSFQGPRVPLSTVRQPQ